jgi:hypothetical protein
MQEDLLLAHVGMGARMLLDHGRDRAGLNVYLGFEAFYREPIHWSGSIELARVGNADILRGRTAIGVNWRNVEGYLGYDIVNIGSVNLQGPFLGIQLSY